MCGIIAVVRRPSTRPTPDAQDVVVPVTGLAALLRAAADGTEALHTTADELTTVDALLRGVPGVRLLLEDESVRSSPFDVIGVFYAAEEGPQEGNELEAVFEQAGWLDGSELGIILEPTNMNLELGCQGVINARVSFIGTSAHSARPWLGENAVTKAGSWLQAMGERQPESIMVGGLEFKEVMTVTRANGGIANNIPIDVVQAMGADIVIAVDISTPLEDLKDHASFLSISGQVLSILMRRNVDEQLARLGPDDVLLQPELGGIGTFSFTRSKEAMRLDSDKKMEAFKARGGVMDEEPLSAERVKEISKWPSREEQLGILAGQMLGPGRNLAAALIGPGGTLASQIDEKSKDGD